MASEIQFQSALPELIKQIAGSKTVTTNTGDTTGLDQVLQSALANSQLNSAGMQQLIASIFTQGAQAVPGLTQAYANATGTRTTGNSGLKLALDDLNRSLSTQAAQAMLQNQQQNLNIAGNAAGNIARTTSSSTQKTPVNGNALGMYGLGMAANFLDKKGVFDKIGKAFTGDTIDPLNQVGPQQMPAALDSSFAPYITSDNPFAVNPNLAGDAALNLDFGGMDFGAAPSFDFSTMSDFGGVGTDFGGFGTGDAFDNLDYGMFFADGGSPAGLLRRREAAIQAAADATALTGADTNTVYQQTMAPASAPASAASAPASPVNNPARSLLLRKLGFADGGSVVRNRNYMGDRPITQGTPSYDISGFLANSPEAQALIKQRNRGGAGSDGESPDATSVATSAGGPGGINISPATASGISLGAGLAGIPGVGSMMGMANAKSSQEVLGKGAVGALGMINPVAGLLAMIASLIMGKDVNATTAGATGVNGIDTSAVVSQAGGVGDVNGVGGNGANSGSISVSNPGTTPGFSVDNSAVVNAADGIGPATGDSGGPAATSDSVGGDPSGNVSGLADGGLVLGPGTGTSDSIDAKLSAKEFVIPADVVSKIGVSTLNDLVRRYHQPVARGVK